MSPKFFVFVLYCYLFAGEVLATPLGEVEYADLISVNGMPAICLPESQRRSFSVGWATLYDSYARNVDAWQVVLSEEGKALVLNSGDCFTYGEVPDGYMLKKLTPGKELLMLEVGKTYAFRLNSASRSVDAYFVIFCLASDSKGSVRFVKYPPLSSSDTVPFCDGPK